ncbi:hypothetical protein ATCC90586_001733 [Pythium insidiosum]|nr:hypothetical protein ATCC90586_001733 [Pythium insidiosum]
MIATPANDNNDCVILQEEGSLYQIHRKQTLVTLGPPSFSGKQRDDIPQEIWEDMLANASFISRALMFLMAAVMWAYYTCMSAQDFYALQFPDINFPFLTTFASSWPLCAGHLLQLLFGLDKKISHEKRVIGGFLVFMLMAVVIILCSAVSWEGNTTTGAVIVLVCIGVMGAANAIAQSVFYVIASLFPMERFTNAVQIGNVAAGVINTTLGAALRLIVGGIKQNEGSQQISFFLFFAILIGVCLSGIAVYRRLVRLRCVEYLLARSAMLQANAEADGEEMNMLHRVADYWRVFKLIAVPAIAQFLVFFVSLSVYPGIGCAAARVLDQDDVAVKWYCSPGIIGSFNYGECLGRVMCTAAVYRIFTMKRSLVGTVLRLAFFPLLLMNVYGSALYVFGGVAPTVPLVYGLAVNFVVGMSGGILATVTMGSAPLMVGVEDREAVSAVMVLALFLGVANGATFGLLVRAYALRWNTKNHLVKKRTLISLLDPQFTTRKMESPLTTFQHILESQPVHDDLPLKVWEDISAHSSFIYRALLFLSAAVMWAYYTCMSAQDFYVLQFPDTNFAFLTTFATAWPVVGGHLVQILFGLDKKVSHTARVVGGFAVFMVMAGVIMLCSAISWEDNASTGAAIVLACIGVMGAANAIVQSVFYAIAALFPMERFTNAVQIGNVAAGVVNITLSTLLRLIVGGIKQNDGAQQTSFFLFFAILIGVCITGIIVYRRLVRLPCVDFLITRNQALQVQVKSDDSPHGVIQRVQKYWRVFKLIAVPAIAQFLVFFVSLGVYPGIGCAAARVLDQDDVAVKWYCSPGIIGSFNYGECLGRVMCTAAVYRIFTMKRGGILATVTMGSAPLMVGVEDREAVSAVMVLFMFFGVAFGATSGFLINHFKLFGL